MSLGGSVSPVDALSLLIEFLTIAGTRRNDRKTISAYPVDETGQETISILINSLEVVERITGNASGSLGLHPAVYFYNERGKYSRFLFLGMSSLLVDKIRNNDSSFFKKLTKARAKVEEFLAENKSLITNILQNLSKATRVPRIRSLFEYLIIEYHGGRSVRPEQAIAHLGLKGRIFDVSMAQTSPQISDDTKSMIFVRDAMKQALKCPLCGGSGPESFLSPTIISSRDGRAALGISRTFKWFTRTVIRSRTLIDRDRRQAGIPHIASDCANMTTRGSRRGHRCGEGPHRGEHTSGYRSDLNILRSGAVIRSR